MLKSTLLHTAKQFLSYTCREASLKVGLTPFHISNKLQPSCSLLGLCNLLLHLLVLVNEVTHAGSFREAVACSDGLELFQHTMQPCSVCTNTACARYSACLQMALGIYSRVIVMRHSGFHHLRSVFYVQGTGRLCSIEQGPCRCLIRTFWSAMSISLSCLLVYLSQSLKATANQV